MHFSTLAIASTLAAAASAGTVHFVNQDSTTRTIIFTPNAGLAEIASITIPGSSTADQAFPEGWIGNFYSVSQGAQNIPGMLGEVAWDSWAENNYFDVSAIVNPNDIDGVKMLYPLVDQTVTSGCTTFPCDNVYIHPDDVQTKSTKEDTLVCLLGTAPATTRRSGGAVAVRSILDSIAARQQ